MSSIVLSVVFLQVSLDAAGSEVAVQMLTIDSGLTKSTQQAWTSAIVDKWTLWTQIVQLDNAYLIFNEQLFIIFK